MLDNSDLQTALIQSNSSISSDAEERACKICYGADNVEVGEWMTPCRCNGTIKWVHEKCLIRWLEKAPIMQRTQCTMCKYTYRRCWTMKPMNRWCVPRLGLNFWDYLEIFLDLWGTIGVVRHIKAFVQGTTKSVIRPLLYIFFWRCFIFNNRRIHYYVNLGRGILSSVLEYTVQNAL